MNPEMVVEMLWTGGFDSTYRMVQLSQLPIIIQPYYVSDFRESERHELGAMESIARLLAAKPKTRATILPVIVLRYHQRASNREISDAFKRLRKTDVLGSQYDWLGVFASQHPGIEMSVSENERPTKLIAKYGKLIQKRDAILGDYYVLDTVNSSPELFALFQYYHFPFPYLTKDEMKKNYVEWGYEDVMNQTWFCYTPIDGEPCGVCVPCRQKIKGGWLNERFSAKAMRRYGLRRFISPILKVRSGMVRQWKILTERR